NADHTHRCPVEFKLYSAELPWRERLCTIWRLKIRQRDAHRLEDRLPIFFVPFFIDDGKFCELLLEGWRNRNKLAHQHIGSCAFARDQFHGEGATPDVLVSKFVAIP